MSKFLEFFRSNKSLGIPVYDSPPAPEIKSDANFGMPIYGPNYQVISKKWDGEKTLGELGMVIRNIPDYEKLRLRALDAYVKTDTVKIIASKHFDWVVGSGLKLQVEPNKTVLESEGIKFESSTFQKLVEARFMVYANSVNCDYSKQKNLHQLANDFYKAKYLGGDCLCISRYSEYGPNVQFVSAEFVCNPDQKEIEDAKARGNTVEHGIEINDKCEHIAYFVKSKSKDLLTTTFERIEVIGQNSGRKMAWMVYGERISPDHKRGVPKIAQILEKVNKLDRYTEASVGKAEQAAKILYAITHENFSTGENPLDAIVKNKLKINGDDSNGYALADGLANRVIETTSNMTINMPPGAKLQSFGTDIESDYAAFESANFNKIAAASSVPPEVAMQSYNSNYSASRAAINGWGYVVDIDRKDFQDQFYIPFYKLWLEYEILSNKIQAPGYIKALNDGNFMITDSYSQCRFIGKNMPHIDPLKEIKAIREMLGDDQTALISREQATEALGSGEWSMNYMKNLEEEKIIVVKEEPLKINPNGAN